MKDDHTTLWWCLRLRANAMGCVEEWQKFKWIQGPTSIEGRTKIEIVNDTVKWVQMTNNDQKSQNGQMVMVPNDHTRWRTNAGNAQIWYPISRNAINEVSIQIWCEQRWKMNIAGWLLRFEVRVLRRVSKVQTTNDSKKRVPRFGRRFAPDSSKEGCFRALWFVSASWCRQCGSNANFPGSTIERRMIEKLQSQVKSQIKQSILLENYEMDWKRSPMYWNLMRRIWMPLRKKRATLWSRIEDIPFSNCLFWHRKGGGCHTNHSDEGAFEMERTRELESGVHCEYIHVD